MPALRRSRCDTSSSIGPPGLRHEVTPSASSLTVWKSSPTCMWLSHRPGTSVLPRAIDGAGAGRQLAGAVAPTATILPPTSDVRFWTKRSRSASYILTLLNSTGLLCIRGQELLARVAGASAAIAASCAPAACRDCLHSPRAGGPVPTSCAKNLPFSTHTGCGDWRDAFDSRISSTRFFPLRVHRHRARSPCRSWLTGRQQGHALCGPAPAAGRSAVRSSGTARPAADSKLARRIRRSCPHRPGFSKCAVPFGIAKFSAASPLGVTPRMTTSIGMPSGADAHRLIGFEDQAAKQDRFAEGDAPVRPSSTYIRRHACRRSRRRRSASRSAAERAAVPWALERHRGGSAGGKKGGENGRMAHDIPRIRSLDRGAARRAAQPPHVDGSASFICETVGKWGASVARCSPYRWNPLLLPGGVQPRFCLVTSVR